MTVFPKQSRFFQLQEKEKERKKRMEAEKSKRKPVVDMNAGLYSNCGSVCLKEPKYCLKAVSVSNCDLLVPSRAFHSLHVSRRLAWLTSHVFPPFVPPGYLLSQLRAGCIISRAWS